MIQPEWGTKRSCPKCGVRFYDLGKEEPVTCIACGAQWEPDLVLKSKQPMPFDAPKKEVVKEDEPEEAEIADELDIDEDEEGPVDDENDLGGDDDLGVATREAEEEH